MSYLVNFVTKILTETMIGYMYICVLKRFGSERLFNAFEQVSFAHQLLFKNKNTVISLKFYNILFYNVFEYFKMTIYVNI